MVALVSIWACKKRINNRANRKQVQVYVNYCQDTIYNHSVITSWRTANGSQYISGKQFNLDHFIPVLPLYTLTVPYCPILTPRWAGCPRPLGRQRISPELVKLSTPPSGLLPIQRVVKGHLCLSISNIDCEYRAPDLENRF